MHGDPDPGHHPRVGNYPDDFSASNHKIRLAIRHKM
jgi:hypothetical protein